MYARLIRWAFTRFYREFAWTYDVVAALVSWGRWRRWTLAALPVLSGDILELGCGTGNLQAALHLAGDREPPHLGAPPVLSSRRPITSYVVGIDASYQMIQLTRRKVPSAGLARADARELPFGNACFDTVVATFPSEYIVATATLAEVQRVLRPSGTFIIILGAQLTGPRIYQRLIALAYRMLLLTPPATQQPTGSATTFLEAISAAGMHASDAWIPSENSWVYLITAHTLL